MGFTVFDPPNPSDEVTIDLDAELAAGSYGVVFGACEFGATGLGALPHNDADTPEGVGSYFRWDGDYQGGSWRNTGENNMRFFALGTASPEPPEVEIAGGACPGAMTSSVRNVTPNGTVAWVYGFGVGPTSVPVGFPCEGTSLDVGAPNLGYMTTIAAPEGEATLSTNVPLPACGAANLQVLDLTSCETSNVILVE